jgi:hypothetical protein
MGLVSVTSQHVVTVLEPNISLGTSAGAAYNYQPADPPVRYLCRVVPFDSKEAWQLLERGIVLMARMHFHERPVGIDERKRLLWENQVTLHDLNFSNGLDTDVIFRLASIPRNSHGLGRKWVLTCVAKTEDQPNLGTP